MHCWLWFYTTISILNGLPYCSLQNVNGLLYSILLLDTGLLHSSRPLNGKIPNHQVQCLYDNDMYDNHHLIMMMRMQPNNNRETCTQKGPNKVQASQVNYRICLNQLVCMSFVVGFGWFWVVLFEGKSPHMKTFLICDGLPGQEIFRQLFPMNSSRICPINELQCLVTHMKHLHTCLADISSFIFSQQTTIFQ